MIRRFLLIMTAALVLQGTVFAIYYDDLLYLRRPLADIVERAPDDFARQAESALARERLTLHHLDSIAGGAQAFNLGEIEVVALERRVSITPSDRGARLRLADALRRATRLPEAEHLYLELLESAASEP